MDRSTVIYLVNETYEKDAYGVARPKQTKRKIFANVQSATLSEFFNASQIGLKPDYTFTILRQSYHDEKLAEYRGVMYTVYRTYIRRNDELELHVMRKAGNG